MRKQTCLDCGATPKRIDTYDAYACRTCLKWTEYVCSDPSCTFCVGRPEVPTPEMFDTADEL